MALFASGCCKILNWKVPCPDPVKCPTCPNCGCTTKPMTYGFTGGNEPGLHETTSISVSDIAVVSERTSVTMRNDSTWHLHTEIAVDHGNNSTKKEDTHALILLPPDCQVLSVEAVNVDGSQASWTQCHAYLRVDLAQLDPRVIAEVGYLGLPAKIDVKLERSPYTSADEQPAFAVMVYSGMPDMRPDNNYWWWKNHHNNGLTGGAAEGATWFPSERPSPARPHLN